MEGVRASLGQLIGPYPVQTAHQQVAIYHRLKNIPKQRHGHAEALVLLHAVEVQRDHGNMSQIRFFQRAPDKGHIVAGPATAAGLGHHNGQLVRIVFPGQHRLHDLTHHSDGGEAGVVVDKFEACIDGCPVVVVQQNHIVAVSAQHRLHQFKVDWTHLGCQDGIALLAHLTGEFRSLVFLGSGLGQNPLLPAHIHGRQQAADPDAHRAQVVYLIDFQQGVELVALFQDLRHLVGGHRIQAAAKGIQLDQLQIVSLGHKFRGGIQSGVIHPLIHHPQRPLGLGIQRQAVLGEYRQTIGGNQFRDAVVDLRIDVIGSAAQHDASALLGFHFRQQPGALPTDIRLGLQLLLPGRMDGGAHFLFRDLPLLSGCFHQPVGGSLLGGQGDKGANVMNAAVRDFLHVVFQILRVGDHNGTVVVILGILCLLVLIKHTGMENLPNTLVNQPLHMTMGQLSGIALRL